VVEIALPLPDAAPQEPVPVVIEQVQVTPVTETGTVSDTEAPTVAPVTFEGPLFVTVTVYVIGAPGVAVVAPSVLVIARSACALSVSVSVAELFPGVGSVTPPGAVTVAVLVTAPVAEPEIVPLTV